MRAIGYRYLTLAKPGIVCGNALTMVAGFCLATEGVLNVLLLLQTLLGISLIMASSCVCNQWMDRAADAEMFRTRNRPLVTGDISPRQAFIFAVALLASGILCLFLYTNLLTLWVGLFGFVAYVGAYTVLKYYTPYGTLIGSISGSIPPVVGYTAVSHSVDGVSILLFLLLVCWQMAHFFAIGIYRKKEYAAACIPIWPLVKGVRSTQRQISWYIGGFCALLPLIKMSVASSALMMGMSLWWLILSVKKREDETGGARQIFRWSLLVISAFSMVALFEAAVL